MKKCFIGLIVIFTLTLSTSSIIKQVEASDIWIAEYHRFLDSHDVIFDLWVQSETIRWRGKNDYLDVDVKCVDRENKSWAIEHFTFTANDNFSDRNTPKAFSVRITSKVKDVPIIYCRFSTDSPAKEIFYICLNKR